LDKFMNFPLSDNLLSPKNPISVWRVTLATSSLILLTILLLSVVSGSGDCSLGLDLDERLFVKFAQAHQQVLLTADIPTSYVI
jgi:hypothetical protein